MAPPAARRARAPSPLLLGALAAAAYLVALALGLQATRLVAKPLPALCLAAWVVASGSGRRAGLTGLGLLLSSLGDLLLELPGLFLAGLSAFLAAHLVYAAGFLAEVRDLAPWRAVPFAAWGAGAYAALRSGLGEMAAPVAVYVLAICAMMWRAAACVGRTGRGARADGWALGGAILFAASDTLIAFDRFRSPIPGVRYPIILLYWLGQLGIAASAARRTAPPA